MKILKFRIYDKTEKRMKFLDNIWNMPDPSYDFDEIQQFTGLLDRYGKEIWEGDIVANKTSVNNGVVIFEDGAFLVQRQQPKNFTYPLNLKTYLDAVLKEETQVVGNIYENPELLTL